MSRFVYLAVLFSACGLFVSAASSEQPAAPEYTEQIAPLLKKYCTGCHNADEPEGKLSLESFADLQKGGKHGPALLPGNAGASRMVRVLTGQAKPAMPPKDEPQPSQAEIKLLAAWIDAGALGPMGAEPDRTMLLVPKIAAPAGARRAITSVAYSPDGKLLAVARFREVELLDTDSKKTVHRLSGHPGKVNSVAFSRDGRQLIAASGVTGLVGEAWIWNVREAKLVKKLRGHRDTLYAAVADPGGKLLATGSYDRRIILWDIETKKPLREMTGHNGAIYDLAFSPDGTVLASASADETVKLWQVSTGQRLDTLGQPLEEQFAVAFSPNGRYVVAAGADNRVRVWRFVSRDAPRINPLIYSRFGHEGAILSLSFSADGRRMATVADDRTVKLWATDTFTPIHVYDRQPDSTPALAMAPAGDALAVGRMDGSLNVYSVDANVARRNGDSAAAPPAADNLAGDAAMNEAAEQEPNDRIAEAARIRIPSRITGTIHPKDATKGADVDLFSFEAVAGQSLMLEINAARSKSPLDSKIEVLDAAGRPVPRVLLRAVRDSYFTFRGKDSNTSDDFRLHNWQEMELNEYLYAGGEVVKLYHYPRGPDSGFKVYPNEGKRYGYFDTTAISHALHAPCYIVEPHLPGTELLPGGLPVFPIYYENDDDALRRWGADSRLTFSAPATGVYHVRVTDVRGFGGEKYKYTLTLRPRKPDFKVTLQGAGPNVAAGSGKKFTVKVERFDGFDGELRVDIANLPPGFVVTTPLVIQAEQLAAHGTLRAFADAPAPTKENASATQVTATAQINGKSVTKDVNNLGEIKLAARPALLAKLAHDSSRTSPPAETPDADQPLELTIHPGETITATLRVERHGHKGLVSFGGAEAGWNLPHGVYVDNIGLNGVLIPAGESERTIFVTAAKWVPDTSRPFFLESKQAENQTTPPVILHVARRGHSKQ